MHVQRKESYIWKNACLNLPVTNAFWSCPLNPVAHGLTVATLLVLKRYTTMLKMRINAAPPTMPPTIATWWFFELLLSCGIEPGAGKGEGELETFWLGEAGFFTVCGVSEADGEGEGDGDGDGIGEGDGDGDGEGKGVSGIIAARLWGSAPGTRDCSSLRRPFLLRRSCLEKRMT